MAKLSGSSNQLKADEERLGYSSYVAHIDLRGEGIGAAVRSGTRSLLDRWPGVFCKAATRCVGRFFQVSAVLLVDIGSDPVDPSVALGFLRVQAHGLKGRKSPFQCLQKSGERLAASCLPALAIPGRRSDRRAPGTASACNRASSASHRSSRGLFWRGFGNTLTMQPRVSPMRSPRVTAPYLSIRHIADVLAAFAGAARSVGRVASYQPCSVVMAGIVASGCRSSRGVPFLSRSGAYIRRPMSPAMPLFIIRTGCRWMNL